MTLRGGGCARAATAVFLAVSIAGAATSRLKAWRDGPVIYLLSPEEYEKFGRLKDAEERESFIERFWKRLDRQPSTDRNEFRETFESRCATASERFETVEGPGWRSDRGRVFILLGEPSVVRHGPGGVKAADTEVWIYGNPDDPASDLRITFYRCAGEDFQLDAGCPPAGDMTSVARDWERSNTLRRIVERNPGLSRSRLRNLMGAILTATPGGIAPAERPPVSGDTGGRAAPVEPADRSGDVHALEPEAFFFLARDGTVLTLLSIELLLDAVEEAPDPGDDEGSYLGAASIRPAGASDPPNDLRTIVLSRDHAGTPRGPAVFLGSDYLEAGRSYEVRYAVKDLAHDALLVRHTRLSVPQFGGGLSISSIVPAADFGPAQIHADEPFRVGSEAVIPKPGGIFHRADLLRLYFQVYGAQRDPRTSKPRVDVEFRFDLVGPGAGKRVGRPFSVRGATGPSMGIALPIGDWPAGAYKVSVALRDRVSGQRTSADAGFRIVED